MKKEQHNSLHEFNFESRLPGESALAFRYFQIYRDAGNKRSLRSLCNEEVDGKKRALSQLGRWSSQFSWQTRVEAFDAVTTHAAFQKLADQRKEEITNFISEDLAIALKLQNLCKKRLHEVDNEGDKIDCKELRQLALAYKESRIWLMELTGIVSGVHEDET